MLLYLHSVNNSCLIRPMLKATFYRLGGGRGGWGDIPTDFNTPGTSWSGTTQLPGVQGQDLGQVQKERGDQLAMSTKGLGWRGDGGGVGCSVHIMYLSSLVKSHQKHTHPSLLPTGMRCASGQPSVDLRTCLQLGQGNAKHNDKRKSCPPLMPWEGERVILLLPNVLFHFY